MNSVARVSRSSLDAVSDLVLRMAAWSEADWFMRSGVLAWLA
jgi:hypothetical protein